jgi:tetrahydromethanopterin S-methyltransferase subunit F
MTLGSKRNITEQHRNLSVGAASTGTIGGEAGLVFVLWLRLVLLI